MRPTIRQLQYIVAVAETGQIGAAARQLNVSQPSLSAQLAEVEADLGVQLFSRSRRGVTATRMGEEVIRRARAILYELQDLRAAVQQGGIFKGRLRIGVLASVGPYLLPNVVRRLHLEHPNLRLVVREESTQDLKEGLSKGRFDLVISTADAHPNDTILPLFEERFWAAIALDNPLANKTEGLTRSDLRGKTLLTLSPNYRLALSVSALAADVGARVSDEYEGTSLDAIRLMAASGAGIAILPQIYAVTEAQRGTDVALVALKLPKAKREVSLIQPMLAEPRPGLDALVDILREEAEAILARKIA